MTTTLEMETPRYTVTNPECGDRHSLRDAYTCAVSTLGVVKRIDGFGLTEDELAPAPVLTDSQRMAYRRKEAARRALGTDDH